MLTSANDTRLTTCVLKSPWITSVAGLCQLHATCLPSFLTWLNVPISLSSELNLKKLEVSFYHSALRNSDIIFFLLDFPLPTLRRKSFQNCFRNARVEYILLHFLSFILNSSLHTNPQTISLSKIGWNRPIHSIRSTASAFPISCIIGNPHPYSSSFPNSFPRFLVLMVWK